VSRLKQPNLQDHIVKESGTRKSSVFVSFEEGSTQLHHALSWVAITFACIEGCLSVGCAYVAYLHHCDVSIRWDFLGFLVARCDPCIVCGARSPGIGTNRDKARNIGIGCLLLPSGGLPAVYAVVSHQLLASNTYLGLLILFIIGGIIYLRHDAKLRTVDADSKAIPAALFFYSWKFIGLVIVLFTCLSFVLDWLVNTAPGHTDTWTVDLVMLLYGLLLCWFTIPVPVAEAPSPLLTTKRPVFKPRSTMAMAAKAKKPAIKKTSTSQKKR
jgi:hypothetical protein